MTVRLARMVLGLVVILLLTFAWLGITGGIKQWPESHSWEQKAQTFAQFAYGIFALVAVISMSWRPEIVRLIRTCWLICVTVAAGLAPVAWGEAGWGPGMIAGLGALGIGVLMLWLLKIGTRS